MSANTRTSPPPGATTTRTEWGLTPQAALDIGNPGHLLTAASGIITEATAREAQARLGGVVRRRQVTVTTTDWEDVAP